MNSEWKLWLRRSLLALVILASWAAPWHWRSSYAQTSMGPTGAFVTVTNSGTPVQFTSSSYQCSVLRIQPRKNSTTVNVGNVYIGSSTLNKSTGAGVYAILSPEQVEGLQFDIPWTAGVWPLNPSNWYVDADNSADAVLFGCVK